MVPRPDDCLWCCSPQTDRQTRGDGRRRKQLSVLPCWWYQAFEWLVEIGRQRHDWHVNESCMKEITISRDVYQGNTICKWWHFFLSVNQWAVRRSADTLWWVMCLQLCPLPVHIASGWLEGCIYIYIRDIGCFQVQKISGQALVMCSWNNNVPSWIDSFSSKTP